MAAIDPVSSPVWGSPRGQTFGGARAFTLMLDRAGNKVMLKGYRQTSSARQLPRALGQCDWSEWALVDCLIL